MREQKASEPDESPIGVHILKVGRRACHVRVFRRRKHTIASIGITPVNSLGDLEWLGNVNGFTAGVMVPHLQHGRVFLFNALTQDVVEMLQAETETGIKYHVVAVKAKDFEWMQTQ